MTQNSLAAPAKPEHLFYDRGFYVLTFVSKRPVGTCTPLLGPSPRGTGSALLASRRDEWASSGKQAVTEGLPACGPSSATKRTQMRLAQVSQCLATVPGGSEGGPLFNATIMSAGYSSFGCQPAWLFASSPLPPPSIVVSPSSQFSGKVQGVWVKLLCLFLKQLWHYLDNEQMLHGLGWLLGEPLLLVGAEEKDQVWQDLA